MWLHSIGDFVREQLAAVPMPAARFLFVLLPLLLLLWVCRLPRTATTADDAAGGRGPNLKWAAAAALSVQVIVYWIEFLQGR